MPYVPIIDISRDPGVVGAELDEICRTVGFFQIIGHGIDNGVADRAWTAATRFFDLPLDDKLSVVRPTADYPYGYIPVAGESLSQSMTDSAPPDLKEVFNIGPVTAPRHEMTDPDEASVYAPNLWPAPLPELKEAWTAYYVAMRDLGNRLMSLFALGLGLPADFFAAKIDQCPNALRAINYPARDIAALPGQLRAGAHTDYGTLTILRQDTVGGLEVLDASGNWVGVASVPGAFVINIGDLMARWTNDRWHSTLHRVVDPPAVVSRVDDPPYPPAVVSRVDTVPPGDTPDPDGPYPRGEEASRARRQSMPYFQNSNWSAEISCLPTCLAPGELPRYEPVLAGPHLMSKFRKSVKL
jgi:isopenicillin N synthase-like dioxygenase